MPQPCVRGAGLASHLEQKAVLILEKGVKKPARKTRTVRRKRKSEGVKNDKTLEKKTYGG